MLAHAWLAWHAQEQIRRSAQEAAVTHYHAFIDTARCLKVMRDDMQVGGP